MLKKVLPYTYFVSLLTIILNVFTVIYFAIKYGIYQRDFVFMIFILFASSVEIIFLCKSIYNFNVNNGIKSIKKIVNVIFSICLINLYFLSFAFIEGINTNKTHLLIIK